MKTNVDNPKIDRILEKLRKLMDLEASARNLGNEGEANAAAAGINRLLLEYNLELEDVPAEQKIKDPVERELVEMHNNIPYMDAQWYRTLFYVICNYNLCKALRSTTDRTCLYVVGRKTNRETCLYLFSFLTSSFVRLGRENYKQFKWQCLRRGVTCPTAAVYMKSYLLGCCEGLENKFKDEQAAMQCNVTALVVSNNKVLQDFLDKEGVGKGRRTRQQDVIGEASAQATTMAITFRLKRVSLAKVPLPGYYKTNK